MKSSLYMIQKIVLVCAALLGALEMASAQHNWYAHKSGSWDDASVWTTDPSGALPNGSGLQPGAGDHYTILEGKEISVTGTNTVAYGELKVEGILNLGSATGRSFTRFSGEGTLRLSADVYPGVAAGNDLFATTGTVVYFGNGFSLNGNKNFKHVWVNLNAGQTLTLQGNLLVSGDFKLLKGNFKVNDTSTTSLLMEVNGNVETASGTHWSVGTGNALHRVKVYGNWKQYGTLKFTNQAQHAAATNGAVLLEFLGTSDTQFEIGNQTDLYKLWINKGTDATYQLHVWAVLNSHLKLWAPITGTDGVVGVLGTDGYLQLPLVLVNGTLRLGNNVVIPQLGYNRGSNGIKEFAIPASAALWIDGAKVTLFGGTTSNQADAGLALGGLLRLTGGELNLPATSSGIRIPDGQNQAELIVEGGTLYSTRIFQTGTNSRLHFNQSGGSIFFKNLPVDSWSTAVWHQANPASVFEMSGGTMEFSTSHSHTYSGIMIASTSDNSNVTGGTIRVNTPKTYPFKIYSKAPFYNLELNKVEANSVEQINSNGGTTNGYFNGDLKILNNLTIGAGVTYTAGVNHLWVGGDLVNNGIYQHAVSDSFASGTLTLDGSNAARLVNNGTWSLHTLQVSKYGGEVQLDGANKVTVSGLLSVLHGNLNVGNANLELKGSVSLHEGSVPTPANGIIELTGTGTQDLYSFKGAQQGIGTVVLPSGSTTATIALKSAFKMADLRFERNQVVKLGVYELVLTGAKYDSFDSNWKSLRMFETTGKFSDGGLTLPISDPQVTGADAQYFPVGENGRFAPMIATATSNRTTATGLITVKPVTGLHPTVASQNGAEALPYYWQVRVTPGTGTLDKSSFQYWFISPVAISNSMNTGAILVESNWLIDEKVLIDNRTSRIIFSANQSLTGDFTAAKETNGDIFNNPRVLYSRVENGNFADASTWSKTGHTGSAATIAPQSYDFCVIGGAGDKNHQVTIAANTQKVSQIHIKGKSDTGIGLGDAGTAAPTLVVAANTSGHVIPILKGKGRYIQKIQSAYNINITPVASNLQDFCNNTEAEWVFEVSGSGPFYLPAQNVVPVFPNLTIGGTGPGMVYVGWDTDLYVKGKLTVNQSLHIYGLPNGHVKVEGDLLVGNGVFTLPQQGGHQFTVLGNLRFTEMGKLTTPSGAGNDKAFTLHGNVELNAGTIDFSTGQQRFVLAGDRSVACTYTTGLAKFYQLVVDKKEGEKVEVRLPVTLTAPTNGAVKALSLRSGILHLNSGLIKLSLTTGGSNFVIPQTAMLQVDQGAEVNTGGATATGILLDGALHLLNGGKLLMNTGTSGINNLFYSSSGKAKLMVHSGGVLVVGSRLCRYDGTNDGSLYYDQGAQTVVQVGTGNLGTLANRGVFEVVNAGSLFSMGDGAVLKIAKAQAGNAVSDVYLQPEQIALHSQSTIELAGAETDLYTTQPLQNLKITGGKTFIKTVPLTLNGLLQIDSNGVLDAQNQQITIEGDWINRAGTGGFIPGLGTVHFRGLRDQQLDGATSFHTLLKSGAATLWLANTPSPLQETVFTLQQLNQQMGNIQLNIHALKLSGNATIAAGYLFSDTNASRGLWLNGSDHEITGHLKPDVMTVELTNAAGVVNVSGTGSALTIGRKLTLKSGTTHIGGNLLVVQKSATIVAGNAFGAQNMIQTNLSFTDSGIRHHFAQGSNGSYVLPIGANGKYTPVTVSINALGSDNGYIQVRAADEPHLTVLQEQRNRVLQYYWVVRSSGISGFSGTMEFKAMASLVQGDAGKYVGAVLQPSGEWRKPIGDYLEATHALVRPFPAGSASADLAGDYTAGEEDAIPDKVQSFITVKSGNWSDPSVWRAISGSVVDNVTQGPSGGPNGCRVIVDQNHVVVFDYSFCRAYQTTIRQNGTIEIPAASVSNRLGEVDGTGTLRLEKGDMPAGIYDQFFSSAGGTLEYGGSGTYTILGRIATVNHLKISGTGTRSFSSKSILVLGSLTIEGSELDMGNSASVLNLYGNLNFNGGKFSAGSGTVNFAGLVQQKLGGTLAMTGLNAFNHLQINNRNGLSVEQSVDVVGTLSLTSGIIHIPSTSHHFTILNPSADAVVGAGNASYVNGPLRKQIPTGGEFVFPVGASNRLGRAKVKGTLANDVWEVQYFSKNLLPGSSVLNPLKRVSDNETWHIRPVGRADNTALVALRVDALSGFGTDVAGLSKLRVAYLAKDAGSTYTWSGSDSKVTTGAWIESVTLQNFLSQFANVVDASAHLTGGVYALGSIEQGGTVKGSWTGAVSQSWFEPLNWSDGVVPGADAAVVVPQVARFPVIEGDQVAMVNDVVLNANARLTLAPGGKLTVLKQVTIPETAQFVLQQTTDKSVSYIHHGTTTGEYTVERTFRVGRNWYVGSAAYALADKKMGSALPAIANVYGYISATGTWTAATRVEQFTIQPKPMEGYIVVGEGVYSSGTTFTLSQKGALSQRGQASHLLSTASSGWSLVSNPLPYTTDIMGGGFNMDGLDQTIWFRTTDSNGTYKFATFNVAEGISVNNGTYLGADSYIAPFQAFWVKAHAASAQLQFNGVPEHRALATKTKSSKATVTNDVLRMVVTGNGVSDEMALVFRADGSTVISPRDSYKRFDGTGYAQVYHKKAQHELAIGVLPRYEGNLDVPVGISNSKSGTALTLEALQIEQFLPEMEVYLEDLEQKSFVNLRQTPAYAFAMPAELKSARFVLHFSKVATGVNPDAGSVPPIKVFGRNGKAVIWVDPLRIAQGEIQAIVYGLNGAPLVAHEITETHTELALPSASGIYLIEVRSAKQVVRTKITSL